MKRAILSTLAVISVVSFAQARVSTLAYDLNRLTQRLSDDADRSERRGDVSEQELMDQTDRVQRALNDLRQEIKVQAFSGMRSISQRTPPVQSGETKRIEVSGMSVRDISLMAQTASYRAVEIYNISIEMADGRILSARNTVRLNGTRNDFDMRGMIIKLERPVQVRAVTFTTAQKLDWVEIHGR